MNGTFVIPEEVDPIVADLIRTLKRPKTIKAKEEISLCTTAEENKNGWKKMKDKKASAFGTPGFNHYKTTSQFKDLNAINVFMVNSPLITGIVPKGWTHITDVQILKRININNVDKMRCIQLLDAEFNMINKRLGKKIL